MKIKDCISIAANFLNLDHVLKSEELTEVDKLLLRCADNVIDEIASEYIPLKKRVTVKAKDKKIPISDLGAVVYDVIDVECKDRSVPFRLFPAHIEVDKDEEYVVTIKTCPGALTAEDELPWSMLLSERVVAYGIAAEYLLMGGFYNEAVTWDTRFKDALIRAAYGGKEHRVRSRRWLI